MQVEQEENSGQGRFYVERDGRTMAEMTYSKQGDGLLVVEHTEVDETLRGQNVGKLLVEHMVDFARTNQLKVLPLCRFAKVIMEKNESFQDVLSQ